MQISNLSKREQEVVSFLLKGKSNKQIALQLGIAESTVEFHLSNIYNKLDVKSRTEAILKIGKSTGLIRDELRESVVDVMSEQADNDGTFSLWEQWIFLIQETAFAIKKEFEMKNRLVSYFLGGVIFGVAFWYYFSLIGHFTNTLSIDEENVLEVWAFLSIEFLLIFGVWLIPTLWPTIYEFRSSQKIRLSVFAVIVMWISAVIGYYANYIVLLAFVGLPNMDYYLVFGHHSPSFWKDWAELFPRLILFNYLKWTVVGTAIGGITGLITSTLYSFWVKKTHQILSA